MEILRLIYTLTILTFLFFGMVATFLIADWIEKRKKKYDLPQEFIQSLTPDEEKRYLELKRQYGESKHA